MVTCAFCGAVVEHDSEVPPLTWTSSLEDGEPRWYCGDCSRTHLRAIESKLDPEWW